MLARILIWPATLLGLLVGSGYLLNAITNSTDASAPARILQALIKDLRKH